MSSIQCTVDGQTVTCAPGMTILQAADAAGIYILRLCAHPDLGAARDVLLSAAIWQGPDKYENGDAGQPIGEDGHCDLCYVELAGETEPVRACTTVIKDGQQIITSSDELTRRRRTALKKILADHPHACLTCAQKEGCSRTDCSSNVPVDQRCCPLLGHCELQRVSEYIGVPEDTPKYEPKSRPVITDEPLLERDFNLCIGCLRCVRICRDVRQADVLGAVRQNGRLWVGTQRGPSLDEAECRYCGACIEVCPTGALRDKDSAAPVRRGSPLPCANACPAGVDIPRYLRLISQGRVDEAIDLIRSRAPLPGVLGYVCFHPCEDSCRRGEIDEPVAICAAKRFAADHANPDRIPLLKMSPSGKHVAIIGSGPAGLAAAYFLTLTGHQVTVFDKDNQPGGMLRYGIPDYRLPSEILERDLNALCELGVTFSLNYRLRDTVAVRQMLRGDYDAVLLAVGTGRSKKLPLDRSDLPGVYLGLHFLREAKQGMAPRLDGTVLVIGGGNVAIDAAMTARRLGAEKVHLLCLESRETMPAHEREMKQAEEEGITIHPSWGPAEFLASDGRVQGLRTKRCTRVFDEEGRFAPEFDETTAQELDADYVIVSIGQEVEDQFATDQEGIFAAGDVVTGPSSVIDALAQGREAAIAIDQYLGGTGIYDAAPNIQDIDFPELSSTVDTFRSSRHYGSVAPVEERISGFGVIESTLTKDAAKSEAGRCLQCHLRQLITPVTLPPAKWKPLTEEQIAAVPATEGVFQLLDADKNVLRISGTQNLHESLLEVFQDSGNAEYFMFDEDPMYTKRESELIQQYLQEHGELPGGGGDDDLDDLF